MIPVEEDDVITTLPKKVIKFSFCSNKSYFISFKYLPNQFIETSRKPLFLSIKPIQITESAFRLSLDTVI